jgi:hypothetical protein
VASTTAALLAVSAAPRRFNREVRVSGPVSWLAEAPLLSSNVACFLRNHPDRDTAPSPRRNFTNGQSERQNFEAAW